MGNEFKRQRKTAGENDIAGPWRRYYCYLGRAGTTSKIKRQARRRERRELARSIGSDA